MHIIDVRTKEEYELGHREGAIHFDLQDLTQGKLPDVPPTEPVEVYCASGARSAVAKTILETQGYTNVTDGGGGFS